MDKHHQITLEGFNAGHTPEIMWRHVPVSYTDVRVTKLLDLMILVSTELWQLS